MSSLTIPELVSQISLHALRVSEYFSAQNVDQPSHDAGSNTHEATLPGEIAAAKEAALEATHQLHSLLLGPMGLLLSASIEDFKILSLKFIYRHKIAHAFPIGEERAFEEIASHCNLHVADTARVLRLAATHHVFCEVRPGVIRHTAASRMLAQNPLLAAWVGTMTEQNWPAWNCVVDAMEKWPGSEEPDETTSLHHDRSITAVFDAMPANFKQGHALAHGTKGAPFKSWNEQSPEIAKQFADSMSFWHTTTPFSPTLFVNNFEFPTSDKDQTKKIVFVDVGGSHGNVSKAIARKYPNIHCIVQDLPSTVEEGRKNLDPDLRDSIFFQEHDFWKEQPVKGADIYYFRWIFHDWSDKYCVQLLQNQIPALKPGAQIVINDSCMPAGASLYTQRRVRAMDMTMKAFSNAKERDALDWADLFRRADPRFAFKGIQIPPQSRLAIIVGVLAVSNCLESLEEVGKGFKVC